MRIIYIYLFFTCFYSLYSLNSIPISFEYHLFSLQYKYLSREIESSIMKPTSIRFFPKRLGSRPTTSRLFHHPRKESSYMQHHVVGSHFLPTFDRDTLLYLIESASLLPIPFKFHSLYQHSNLHSYACYVDS